MENICGNIDYTRAGDIPNSCIKCGFSYPILIRRKVYFPNGMVSEKTAEELMKKRIEAIERSARRRRKKY